MALTPWNSIKNQVNQGLAKLYAQSAINGVQSSPFIISASQSQAVKSNLSHQHNAMTALNDAMVNEFICHYQQASHDGVDFCLPILNAMSDEELEESIECAEFNYIVFKVYDKITLKMIFTNDDYVRIYTFNGEKRKNQLTFSDDFAKDAVANIAIDLFVYYARENVDPTLDPFSQLRKLVTRVEFLSDRI